MKTNGRGWGKFKKGKRITQFDEISVGKKYLEFSPQFNAKNVVEIVKSDETGLNRPIVYGQFVREFGNEQHIFAIWDYDIRLNVVELFEAVS